MSESVSQSISPSISQPISQTGADHNNHSIKRTAQCNLALWVSHTPRHPLELSVTLLATLSITFNPFCHVTFTHSHSAHVTFTTFSGFLSLMPLSLAWLHPHISAHQCSNYCCDKLRQQHHHISAHYCCHKLREQCHHISAHYCCHTLREQWMLMWEWRLMWKWKWMLM